MYHASKGMLGCNMLASIKFFWTFSLIDVGPPLESMCKAFLESEENCRGGSKTKPPQKQYPSVLPWLLVIFKLLLSGLPLGNSKGLRAKSGAAQTVVQSGRG